MVKQSSNGLINFKIERGIPMPPNGKTKTGLSDALRKLKVGDSLVVPTYVSSSQISGTLARLKPLKFICRRDGSGLRVWRAE